MYQKNNGSIAALGFRETPSVDFHDVVHQIDAALQLTDRQHRKIRWVSDKIAMIDRDGVRIALGCLLPHDDDPYCHLVIAVGRLPGQDPEDMADHLGDVPFIHLADRLVLRIKDFLPYDTILRGESPEPVEPELVESIFDLLRHCHLDDDPAKRHRDSAAHGPTPIDVIDTDDFAHQSFRLGDWAENRAEANAPLRLTVHTIALSVMLYTPPLGAFLFTYSMLRDLTPSSV